MEHLARLLGLRPTGRRKIVVVAFCAVFLAGFAQAGMAENRKAAMGLKARIDAILIQYPADSAAKKDALAAALMSAGRDGILELCRRLAGPGKADDAAARFAVDSLALHAARPGAPEKDRALLVESLLDGLEKAKDADVKDFLISQIQMAGRNEAVRPLSRYLNDARLGGPAIRAIQSIHTPEAEKTLLKALGASSATNRIPLVIALGNLRSRAASKRILPFTESPDPLLRNAALRALGEIGDPASEAVLNRIPVASSADERYAAAEHYLLFARRRAEAGDKALAAAVARNIVEKYAAPPENGIRSQALTLLAEIEGEDVLPELLAAMDSPDMEFRAYALSIAQPMAGPEITRLWLTKLAGARPGVQAEIIGMLGRRGDKDALPAIRESISSSEPAVRSAAMEAAFRLGGPAVLQDFMPVVATAGPAEVETLKAILLGAPGADAVSFSAAALPGAAPLARKALIEILAAREARDRANFVFKEAASEDPDARTAALEALKSVVRETDLSRIIDLLLAAPSSTEVRPLQSAVMAAANRIADPEKRADAILEALEKAPVERKPDLIKPLAGIGGNRALLAVIEHTKSADPQVQTAAVSTLAGWIDGRAARPLLDIVRDAVDRKYAYLALQGYVRLTNASEKPAEEKLALLKEAIGLARDAAERRVVVGGFGAVRGIESFKTAASWLDDPEIRPRAANAAARIAMPLPGEPGLGGVETARTLKRAAAFIESEWIRDLAEGYAEEILAGQGFSALFNGEDLTGWQGLVEDPVKRSKIAPVALDTVQRKADEDMRLHWKAEDGILVFDGKGHSLCTAREYRDFELFVDWKIEASGDSGIYLRGAPQVQIWDPAQWPEGSGGLYNNKIGPAKPLKPADNPVGSWNTFHIIMKGERVTVYLNDVLVVDNVVMENYWERDKPVYPAGRIELQAHSTPLRFRNIRLREI